ncbi:MAG: LysR substrate-binding domain-containing protein [[Clostridium] scindens]
MIARPLSDFLAKHKGADISVTVANTKELLQKLDSGEIDFAILEGDYPKTLYNHQPYIIDNFIPICGKKYPFAAPPARLSDLIGERLILRESGSGTRMILEHMLIENGISLEDFSNVITIGNMSAIKDMVIAGCGITFLYETAVQKELRSGIIKKLDLSDCRIQHEISIVWKKDNLFEDSFKELFEDLFQIC